VSNRALLALLAALALASCAKPEPATPALWQVEGPSGEQAWLFGTIHALRDPVDWRTAKITSALASSDRLVLEVAEIGDGQEIGKIFARLGQSPGLAPLEMRLIPQDRAELRSDMSAAGLAPGALDGLETWAAALALQQAVAAREGLDTSNGIDRALVRGWTKPVEELEGAAAQLEIFDRLAEDDQRALLLAMLHGGDSGEEADRLARAWAQGDMALIGRELEGDFLADPELREALLDGRNRAWIEKLEASLANGSRPFVAVGAAHLAGPEGLPALLSAKGYKVTRVQ
jgi:uncharacterized protein YbaP (TraB family)